MKVPTFISNILRLVNKQHIGLKVVLYIVIACASYSFFKWFQWTMGQQSMYALEPFAGSGKTFTLFHWNKCGHCKKMMPEWAKLKSQYKGNIKLADYESESNPAIMKQNKVEGFPTIRLLEKGKKPVEYEGPRTAQGFMAFLNKQK